MAKRCAGDAVPDVGMSQHVWECSWLQKDVEVVAVLWMSCGYGFFLGISKFFVLSCMYVFCLCELDHWRLF